MGKRNFDLITRNRDLDSAKVEEIAIKTGFQKRVPRKISAFEFLNVFCLLSTEMDVSFSDIAFAIGLRIRQSVSKQAVWKRITCGCVSFLEQILASSFASAASVKLISDENLFSSFSRVLIQDSTPIQLPEKFRSIFSGTKNQRSKYCHAKIQCIYDLKTETFQEIYLTGYGHVDQKAARDIVDFLKPGDLIIRDLGYFVMEIFDYIRECGAFFLSRLRYSTVISYPHTGRRIDLMKLLSKGRSVDIDVTLGEEHKTPVRLVAIPVPEQVAAERRRRCRLERRGNHSSDYMKFLGWNIHITNVDRSVWSSESLYKIYGLRWRIETIFKCWKSHCNIEAINTSSLNQLMSVIYAKLIAATLLHNFLYLALCDKISSTSDKQVSLIRFFRFVSSNLLYVLIHASELITDKSYLDVLSHACCYDKRKRLNFKQMAGKVLMDS